MIYRVPPEGELPPIAPSRADFAVRKKSRTPTARLLAEVNAALASDDAYSALRRADRLRRIHPDNPLILHLLGRVLGRCGDFSNALVQLDAAAKILHSPEIEASAVEMLIQLKRDDEAL